jgi:putative membrane protein
MNTNPLKALPIALVSLGFAAGALAQHVGKSNISHGEREFIEEAAKGGMSEVELGQFAQQHASSEQVKQFAAKMVQDHSKANEELRSLAQAKGVTMPAAPKRGENHEMSKLAKLQGDAFDREYMDHMVKDHVKDVKDFQKQADKAKDADVKNFAANTLPTLQEHLRLAQDADAAVGGKQAKKRKTALR